MKMSSVRSNPARRSAQNNRAGQPKAPDAKGPRKPRRDTPPKKPRRG